MDELRILQLLETTDPKKLAQLERVTRFTPTGAQSANEMLNDELFGTSAGSERRAAKESAQGNNSSVRRSNPLTRTARKKVAGAKESFGTGTQDWSSVAPASGNYSYDGQGELFWKEWNEQVTDHLELALRRRISSSQFDSLFVQADDETRWSGLTGFHLWVRFDTDKEEGFDSKEALLNEVCRILQIELPRVSSTSSDFYIFIEFREDNTFMGQMKGKQNAWAISASEFMQSTQAAKGATESVGFRRANGYRSTEEPAKGAKECIKTPVDESDGGSIFDESVDRKKVPKKRMNVGEGDGCKRGACGADECNAGESVVETGDSKFPEEFDFDAEKFAEEYSIDPETITCVFVEEDPDAKIAEHVELSFTYEESTVILSIYADSTVTETVDAEEVDAQFSANFAEEEDEDGNKQTVLHVDLIDEEGAEDATAEDAPVDDATADEDIDDGAAPNEGDDEPDEAAMYKSIIRKLTEVPDVPEAADELREELESSGLTEEEMNAVYAIRDEAPDAVMSEGDADHKGEDGGNVTDEFIEEHGLDLDPVYSKDHGIKVAKGMDAGTMPGYRKEDKGATESLAAKIIRTSK